MRHTPGVNFVFATAIGVVVLISAGIVTMGVIIGKAAVDGTLVENVTETVTEAVLDVQDTIEETVEEHDDE